MAKDKSEKKSKGEKSAPVDNGFAKPSEASGGGDGWNLTEEAEGELVLFTPTKVTTQDTKDYGEKPVIVADVVVINEKKPEKSEEHSDVFVWGGYLRGALKEFVAGGSNPRRVLGRLVKGKTKERGNYPWLLEDPTEEEIAAATAYLESVDPFAK